MIGRGGGRDRYHNRGEYSPSPAVGFEDKSRNHGRPPSRHLWVGNLFHHVNESEFEDLFLNFGQLESLAFQPGRSYAFVNFIRHEDAMNAIKELQGFLLAGYPLKIEFAKPEKLSRDEDYQRRDNRRSAERGNLLFQRDSKARIPSHEPYYPEKSRLGDKNAEPCEVLWVGFPAYLNVDEMALRTAFSPFGEIEKITAFTGRSYAFVQFRSVMSAIRAKEDLEGNLFDNPRVHICFAKREGGPSEQGKSSANISSPRRNFGHRERSTEFRPSRNFGIPTGELHRESPRFMSDMGFGESGYDVFNRKGSPWTGGSGNFEQMRMHSSGPEQGLSDDIFERHRSNEVVSHRNEYSPGRFRRRSPFSEDTSDFVDDDFPFHEAKKLKIGQFPRDKKLPEYSFFDPGPKKMHSSLSKTFVGLSEHETYDKKFGNAGSLSSNRISDHPMHIGRLPLENDDSWKPTSRFEAGSGSLPTNSNPLKLQAFTPESYQSSLNGEWKWEGTIAKGGTPVCRARCFPVGKLLDITLPDFLNCTARTGLDMLEKHFYQAASAFVVFFVPGSDADISLYNEFLHYLGEKQRAAVSKLGEKTTLFLVPPSEFSEKVLKVPGKMSISGVILKFQHPTGSDFGPLLDSKLPSFNEDIGSYPESTSPDLRPSAHTQNQSYLTSSSSEPFPPLNPIPTTIRKPGHEQLPYLGNMTGSGSAGLASFSSSMARESESLNENRLCQSVANQNQNQSQNSNTLPLNPALLPNSTLPPSWSFPQSQNRSAAQASDDTIKHDHLSAKTSSSSYIPGIVDKFCYQESKPHIPSPIPLLQPEQLVQLASLLGQRQQHQGNGGPVLSAEQALRSSQIQGSSSISSSQGQVHQSLQSTPNTAHSTTNTVMQTSRTQNQDGDAREETETDPQKRLQATLQLAAALLQQIQQQSKV
ncbi:hypothetical protein GIB67_039989 [Kingdonia uniflora]|uniref:RRM domain-containing protein n=1 Tax=Kingdonia uniflora TaxID=39325 RepID=A0A7J7LI86_9MAGN|nr:hypothetical protein GIB67_039989 [Kingdonia uniflora]